MSCFRHSAFLAAVLAASPLIAVDYDHVDRSIAKEPKYQSGKPEYALLLFGSEAKQHVWVVVDGDVVYLDRNGDGDLTAADERFETSKDCHDVEIAAPDGKTRYVITGLGIHREQSPPTLMAYVEIHGPLKYKQYCDAELHATKDTAAIAHFHGPLAIGPITINWLVPPQSVITTGGKPEEVRALIGTMSARHKCWVVVVTHEGSACSFGEGIRPQVRVEFSPKDPRGAAVVKDYPLDEFC